MFVFGEKNQKPTSVNAPTCYCFYFYHLAFTIKFTETEKAVSRYGFVWVNWAADYVHGERYSVGGSFINVS